MEEEIEFQRMQGDISEELAGLNESLALKQALLRSQGTDAEEVAALQEKYNQLEAQLQGVSRERESLLSQVCECGGVGHGRAVGGRWEGGRFGGGSAAQEWGTVVAARCRPNHQRLSASGRGLVTRRRRLTIPMRGHAT